MSERIVPQLMVLIFISTSAVCGSDSTGLDEYKEILWTDSGLEMALDEFSHSVDCDLHYPNSSCSGCLGIDRTKEVLNDTVDSYRLAVYLLTVQLDRGVHCSNDTVPYPYQDMVMELALDSSTHESLEETLKTLLSRLNATLTSVVHDNHHENGDNQTQEEAGEDDNHHDDLHRCFGTEVIMKEYTRSDSHRSSEELISFLVVSHLLSGDKLLLHCDIGLSKQDFTQDILHQLSVPDDASHISLYDLEYLMTKVVSGSPAEDEEEDDGDTSHDHTAHKRSVHDHEDESVTKCLSAEEIAFAFGIENGESIPLDSLPDLSLALIQQNVGGYCTSPVTVPTREPTAFQKWGLSTIAVAVISSLALIGGVLFPCLNHDFVQDVLTLFVGLAIGTMAGDALLHLIPQALGLHEHSHDEHSSITIEDYIGKMLIVIAAIYIFFIFETLMAQFGGHSHLGDGNDHSHTHEKSNKRGVAPTVTIETNRNEKVPNGVDNKAFDRSNPDLTYSNDSVSSTSDMDSIGREGQGSPKVTSWLEMPTVAYMVIAGDALHNFVDGLAIGAAFADSYEAGLAISIAVICHELPHELGDFAVLLATGLSPVRVLLCNLFCACCAFIGLYIGIAVSSSVETRQWIFAATAGMFLYVALVNMIPELARRKCKSKCRLALLQNVGLLVGFGCMLMIAVFEDHIRF